MQTGAVTLAQIARHAKVLEVACDRCERRGRYRVAVLIARYGPGKGLPDLAAELSADCPRRESSLNHDRCNAFFPQLRVR